MNEHNCLNQCPKCGAQIDALRQRVKELECQVAEARTHESAKCLAVLEELATGCGDVPPLRYVIAKRISPHETDSPVVKEVINVQPEIVEGVYDGILRRWQAMGDWSPLEQARRDAALYLRDERKAAKRVKELEMRIESLRRNLLALAVPIGDGDFAVRISKELYADLTGTENETQHG